MHVYRVVRWQFAITLSSTKYTGKITHITATVTSGTAETTYRLSAILRNHTLWWLIDTTATTSPLPCHCNWSMSPPKPFYSFDLFCIPLHKSQPVRCHCELQWWHLIVSACVDLWSIVVPQEDLCDNCIHGIACKGLKNQPVQWWHWSIPQQVFCGA